MNYVDIFCIKLIFNISDMFQVKLKKTQLNDKEILI